MAACVVRLDRRPGAGQHCVSIAGLAPGLDPSKLERFLRECGGPLENLIIHQSQYGERGSNFATAQFFCEMDRDRCVHNCDQRLLNGRWIQVTRQSKTGGWSSDGAILELPAAKAIELMNHFLGFNGWTSEILSLGAVGEGTAIGFEARVVVRVASSDVESMASAVGDCGTCMAGAAGAEVGARRKKTAVTNAVKAALARLAIIAFPSGKVAVRAIEMPADAALSRARASVAAPPVASHAHAYVLPLAPPSAVPSAAVPTGQPDPVENVD